MAFSSYPAKGGIPSGNTASRPASPTIGDTFIPYVLATGVISGANYAIFNANPAVAGANQFEGKLYLYYELYNF